MKVSSYPVTHFSIMFVTRSASFKTMSINSLILLLAISELNSLPLSVNLTLWLASNEQNKMDVTVWEFQDWDIESYCGFLLSSSLGLFTSEETSCHVVRSPREGPSTVRNWDLWSTATSVSLKRIFQTSQAFRWLLPPTSSWQQPHERLWATAPS